MSAHLTEEEQLEALKRWWNENGKSTVVAIIVAVAGYFGYQAYTDQVRAANEAASSKYQDMVETIATAPTAGLNETQLATVKTLGAELKTEAADGFYGQSAALFMAKLAVEANELDKAAAELQWVLSQQPETGIERVTRLRLARVQAAQQQFDQALSTLNVGEAGNFASNYAEVRGDVLLAKGEVDAARTAYQLALQGLLEEDYSRRSGLEMKLADLAVAGDEQAVEASASSEADS